MTQVLRFPLNFTNGRADTVTRDTPTEHKQRLRLLLGYPQGACVDEPAFGTPDLAFYQGGVDPRLIADTISAWEPGIDATVIRDLIDDDSISNLSLEVRDA